MECNRFLLVDDRLERTSSNHLSWNFKETRRSETRIIYFFTSMLIRLHNMPSFHFFAPNAMHDYTLTLSSISDFQKLQICWILLRCPHFQKEISSELWTLNLLDKIRLDAKHVGFECGIYASWCFIGLIFSFLNLDLFPQWGIFGLFQVYFSLWAAFRSVYASLWLRLFKTPGPFHRSHYVDSGEKEGQKKPVTDEGSEDTLIVPPLET